MAAHDGIDELFDEGVYFAHPGALWQAAATRTPTGCCGSTSPRAATSRCTRRRRLRRSQSFSTIGRANCWGGAPRHRSTRMR
jgi:hypothetical protein